MLNGQIGRDSNPGEYLDLESDREEIERQSGGRFQNKPCAQFVKINGYYSVWFLFCLFFIGPLAVAFGSGCDEIAIPYEGRCSDLRRGNCLGSLRA